MGLSQSQEKVVATTYCDRVAADRCAHRDRRQLSSGPVCLPHVLTCYDPKKKGAI